MNNFEKMAEAIQQNFSDKASTVTHNLYKDQTDSYTTELIDENNAWHFKRSTNPTTGHDYSFICWAVKFTDPIVEAPEFGGLGQKWVEDKNIEQIVQIRGDHGVGIQVVTIARNKETSNLETTIVYESTLTSDAIKSSPNILQTENVPIDEVISAVANNKVDQLANGIGSKKTNN